VKRSTDRILTTHTGSLPRPEEVTAALGRRDRGERAEPDIDERIRNGVAEAVRRQVAAGVLVVNDGEASKISYSTYVKERVDGFGGQSAPHPPSPDEERFPGFAASRGTGRSDPACVGPVSYRDVDAVRTDVANLRAALDGADVADAFLSAASLGVVALFMDDQHYGDHEAYVYAVADAMKAEYDEIHRAGFVLQLDCLDLAAGRHRWGDSVE
jgi:5-methyltetrahydropteroyltriglutamate--homocysteine methyltransferase